MKFPKPHPLDDIAYYYNTRVHLYLLFAVIVVAGEIDLRNIMDFNKIN